MMGKSQSSEKNQRFIPIEHNLYTRTPINEYFGVIVTGLDISEPSKIPKEVIDAVISDTHKYRLLIFRQPGLILSAQAQIELSKWFGDVDPCYVKHHASPSDDIFRISNDQKNGCRNVGRQGWHLDGTFKQNPFHVQTMHFWAISKGCNTLFSPMTEVIEELSQEKRTEWEQLYFASGCEGKETIIHPLIYPHQVTGDPALCFHGGLIFNKGFIKNIDPKTNTAEAIYDTDQSIQVLKDITTGLDNPQRMYEHKWQLGDFAILDNRAIAHFATPESQVKPSEGGLRVLHRCTIEGKGPPAKLGIGPILDPKRTVNLTLSQTLDFSFEKGKPMTIDNIFSN